MSKTFTVDRKPYDNYVLYYRKNITINPGLTILTGCNGTGKTTLLNKIKYKLEHEGVPVYSYNNIQDGGSHSISNAGFYGDYGFLASLLCSSEGEQINHNICQSASKIGAFVKKNQNSPELWILFDAIDIGYSIDNIIETKQDLFETILADCKKRGIEVYIVVSANSYEMACGEQCLDIYTGKYITFNSYDEYREYILKTRERKERRYNREE